MTLKRLFSPAEGMLSQLFNVLVLRLIHFLLLTFYVYVSKLALKKYHFITTQEMFTFILAKSPCGNT